MAQGHPAHARQHKVLASTHKLSILVFLTGLALVLAATMTQGGLAVFTDTASVPSNTFTTAASFATATPTPTPTATATATATPAPINATFGSSDDSHVRENFPNSTTNWDFMEVNSEANKNSRSFVRFGISTIPAGSTITSATLTLCADWVPTSTRTYELHRTTAAWGETTLTWNNQPTVAATPTQTQTTPAVASCWTWTVTADVQAWVNGTATNYGWRLKDQTEGNTPGRAMGIRTKEYTADATKRPKLDVTYTPP